MSTGKFRVGLTRDLLTPGGEPSFGKGPLALLDDDPRIEWEYLPESATVITPKSRLPTVESAKMTGSRRMATPSTANPSRVVDPR